MFNNRINITYKKAQFYHDYECLTSPIFILICQGKDTSQFQVKCREISNLSYDFIVWVYGLLANNVIM